MNRRKYNKRKRIITLFTRILLFVLAIGLIICIYVLVMNKKNIEEYGHEKVKRYDQIMKNAEQYPKELINLLKHNMETADFVYNYPKKKDIKPADSVGKVSKGEIPKLLQWDERWGYAEYVDNMIAINGCGPTALSMVVVGLTGDDSITPYKVAQYAQEKGYYVEGTGTAWNLMTEGCRQYRVEGSELPLDENLIFSALEQGNPIICSVGPGDFTNTGHFIVLTATEDGKIQVNDPNSKKKSRLWEYETLAGQIRNLWSFEKY